MKRAFFLAAIALAALTGCGDDGGDTSASGGGGNGGMGGAAGQGGEGAQGGEGQGGEGAQGGEGGGSGGEGGGGNSWEADCLIGCQKLDMCGFANACGVLNVACEQANPMDLASCIVECSAAASTTCDDVNKYTSPNEAPASPNAFAQCVSACPWGGGQNSPAFGCTQCLGAACDTELNDCVGDTACSDWASCAGQCNDPECFTACSQTHPNSFSDPLFACVCNIAPGSQAPVPAGAGTADCTDVCGGLMDPCNQ